MQAVSLRKREIEFEEQKRLTMMETRVDTAPAPQSVETGTTQRPETLRSDGNGGRETESQVPEAERGRERGMVHEPGAQGVWSLTDFNRMLDGLGRGRTWQPVAVSSSAPTPFLTAAPQPLEVRC